MKTGTKTWWNITNWPTIFICLRVKTCRNLIFGEWWEEEGAEVLAFKIVLPEPQCVHNITMDEVHEVVKRLKTDIYTPSEDGSLKGLFKYHLDGYYKLFLERNFNTYDPKLFERNINDKGEYFEYTEAEIVQMLWR